MKLYKVKKRIQRNLPKMWKDKFRFSYAGAGKDRKLIIWAPGPFEKIRAEVIVEQLYPQGVPVAVGEIQNKLLAKMKSLGTRVM